ncbi:MAG: hypothetical protein AAFQ90_11300 [Pseudomonadota bacterium]
MLRKKLIEQRGFRELLPDEVEHVGGGLYDNEYLPPDMGVIVVTGSTGGVSNFGGFGLGGIGSIGAATGAGSAGGGSNVSDAVDNSDDFTDEDGDGLDDDTGEPLTIVVVPTDNGICLGGGAKGGVAQGCIDSVGNTSVRGGIGTPGPAVDQAGTADINELGVVVNTTNVTVNVPTGNVVEAGEAAAEEADRQINDAFEPISDGFYYQFNLDRIYDPFGNEEIP